MQYELFYLVGTSKEPDLDAIKSEAMNIVTQEGGVFGEKEVTEKRKLSYKVKHETHGIYVARRFELEGSDKIQEITRKLNLHTGILRFMISNAAELPALKSKEERIAEESTMRKPAAPATKEKAKVIVKKKERAETPAKAKEEKEVSSEDLDKKLEEILNI